MKTLIRFSFDINSIRRIIAAICCVCLFATATWAQTWYSKGGDPTDFANWAENSDGSGANPTTFVSYDLFVIQTGHTMTTTATWTLRDVSHNPAVEIQSGGELIAHDSIYTYGDLIIDAGGTLTMNASIAVVGNLDLGSYVLSTGSHTIMSDFGTVTRTTGYVIGNLRMALGFGNSTTTFCIGGAAGYSPITVSFPLLSGVTSPDYMVVTVTEATEPHVADPSSVLSRYWTLSAGTFLSFSGTMTVDLTYLHADFQGGYTEADIEDTLKVGYYRSVLPNILWNFPDTANYSRIIGGTTDGGTIEISGISSPFLTSDVTIGATQASLPVEITSFLATPNRLSAVLKWSTSTEVDNSGFDVERRSASQSQTNTWSKIGFVPGAGTSTALQNYTYMDNDVRAGLYEYRLKQIDRNGSFKYSRTMQVEIGRAPKVFALGSNYPNPFNPSTTIEFSVQSDGNATLKIYNVLGQEVATLFDGQAVAGTLNKATFDASRLSSGVYFSRLESGGHALVKRMMLVK
jgi:hypothetical protein